MMKPRFNKRRPCLITNPHHDSNPWFLLVECCKLSGRLDNKVSETPVKKIYHHVINHFLRRGLNKIIAMKLCLLSIML
jgi:hypothetical protein